MASEIDNFYVENWVYSFIVSFILDQTLSEIVIIIVRLSYRKK